jgi:hypothetical protein
MGEAYQAVYAVTRWPLAVIAAALHQRFFAKCRKADNLLVCLRTG